MSHKYGYVGPSFSLSYRKSLIVLFIFSLTQWSLSRELFSLHEYVGFLHMLFLLLLKSSLNPWWSDKLQGIISIVLCLLRLAL